MALIKCPECESEISDKAEACPKCGCPVSKSNIEVKTKTDAVSSDDKDDKSKIMTIIPIIIIGVIIAIIVGNLIHANITKPADMSDEMYSIGTSAIKTIDDYIDNNVDYDTAYQKLEGLNKKAERQAEDETDHYFIKYDISLLKSELYFEHKGSSTFSDLLDKRNELADKLNIGKK